MTILIVNYLLDPVTGGGTAERVFQLAREWARGGTAVCVLTMDEGVTPARRTALHDVSVVTLRTLNRRYHVPLPAPRLVRSLVHTADVVHLVGHWTAINLLAARAARRVGRPVVVSPAGALRVSGRSQRLKRLYNAVGGAANVRDAAAWIAVSTNELDDFDAYGVDRSRVTVVPNGVEPDAWAGGEALRFRQTLGLPDAAPVVLYVGRLAWSKGPDLLLEAFASLPSSLHDHHLVMIGTDEGLLEPLRGSAQARGIAGRVHFPGYVGGTDKADAYGAASLLVIPSRQEAMSIVALEAGASGTPVLLTDRCGFDEVAAVDGGAVVPATAPALRDALTALLADPVGLRARGERLRAHIGARYTWARAAQQHLDLFKGVIGRA